LYVREAEKISQRKDYKSTVQLIETSAHESINIDLAFLLLAQMIDKVKNRVKIISYQESAIGRMNLLHRHDLPTPTCPRSFSVPDSPMTEMLN